MNCVRAVGTHPRSFRRARGPVWRAVQVPDHNCAHWSRACPRSRGAWVQWSWLVRARPSPNLRHQPASRLPHPSLTTKRSRPSTRLKISTTLRETRPPRSGLVQRRGDEPRLLLASVSIGTLDVGQLRTLGPPLKRKRHASPEMNVGLDLLERETLKLEEAADNVLADSLGYACVS
jgi:hypothetical protein